MDVDLGEMPVVNYSRSLVWLRLVLFSFLGGSWYMNGLFGIR